MNLPDLPDDCFATEPHAPLVAGAEIRSVLKRERKALDRQNARTLRCLGPGGHYDRLREALQ